MRTIVGGRPRQHDGDGDGLSRGIDVLLLKGSVDPGFRDLLAIDWRGAAKSIRLELSGAECAILQSVPGYVLADMSARMRLPPAHRSVFVGQAAAAMLAVLAGANSVGCGPPPPPPPGPVPPPLVSTAADVNEPPQWSPGVILILGIRPMRPTSLGDNADPAPFESKNAVEQRADADPGSINEPLKWSFPRLLRSSFGASPKWNDRIEDYESEDEELPEDG